MSGPGGKPPSRQYFIEIAKSYDAGKLQKHGYKAEDKADDEKMLRLGMSTAVVTRESLQEAIKVVGEDKCILIQPYDTSDGLEELDWKRHPYTDSTLMKWAQIFEARDEQHVNLFLGKGHPKKPNVGTEFIENLGGAPKPVVSGSDAHKIADYGAYPSERITWLKAQPTFEGLKQVCHEPVLRCYIGKRPPKLDHIASNPTKYIKELRVKKIDDSDLDEHWFHCVELAFNPGLVAIIGNKGSGKSALADILALSGNSHCKQMEFLTDKRFRGPGHKAKHFEATLTWSDDTNSKVNLNSNHDSLQPERISYLPQDFIENLCNEIASAKETSFERELKKVIFSHVPDERRLQKDTLDSLLEYTISPHKQALTRLQGKLSQLNAQIISTETGLSAEAITSHEMSLKLKQEEQVAHEKNLPAAVGQPDTSTVDEQALETELTLQTKQAEVEGLKEKLSNFREEEKGLHGREAVLVRILGEVSNFEQGYQAFLENTEEDFSYVAINVSDIVKVEIDPSPITNARAETAKRLAEIENLIDGKEGLASQIANLNQAIISLQATLLLPQKQYQQYLKDMQQWRDRQAEILGTKESSGTIEYLKERIRIAREDLPPLLKKLQEQRRDLSKEIHKELLSIRDCYQALYEPVQQIAGNKEYSKEALNLEFDAFLAPHAFEENFLDFIHKGRKGTFYGEDDSKRAVRSLIDEHDFNSADSVLQFLDKLMLSLTTISRDVSEEEVTIQSQLRPNKKLSELYDFIFGMNYLEPRYTLKLSNRDISQLSPGEKGALLLVFYLLLDRDEIPIIIDQPEQNLDNESVVKLLVDCIRQARARRQVIIVTHNPNLAVVCDADQIVYSRIDKSDGHRINYSSGAIEDYEINRNAVDVLEGTYRAFDNRRKKYLKPA